MLSNAKMKSEVAESIRNEFFATGTSLLEEYRELRDALDSFDDRERARIGFYRFLNTLADKIDEEFQSR